MSEKLDDKSRKELDDICSKITKLTNTAFDKYQKKYGNAGKRYAGIFLAIHFRFLSEYISTQFQLQSPKEWATQFLPILEEQIQMAKKEAISNMEKQLKEKEQKDGVGA